MKVRGDLLRLTHSTDKPNPEVIEKNALLLCFILYLNTIGDKLYVSAAQDRFKMMHIFVK